MRLRAVCVAAPCAFYPISVHASLKLRYSSKQYDEYLFDQNKNELKHLCTFENNCHNYHYRNVLGVSKLECRSISPLQITLRHFYTQTIVLHQSWAKINTRPWMCVKEECREVNKSIASICESCGATKPTLRGWKCAKCDTVNYSGVKKCKKCSAAASESSKFWMCAVCKENNLVDEIEDNSRCGYCGYDMAPHRSSEDEILRRAQEKSEELQSKQEEFDSITVKEAEDQWGDCLADADRLPKEMRNPVKKGIKLPVQSIKPYKPPPIPTSAHSKLTKNLKIVTAGVVNDGPPGFDWMCRSKECGQINPGDEEVCMKCGDKLTRSEWECQECGAVNHSSRPRCFACQTTIPVHWICSECKVETSIYEKQCRECNAARPSVEPRSIQEIKSRNNELSNGRRSFERRSDWTCQSCDALNFGFRTECFQCGSAHSSSSSSSRHESEFSSSSRHRDGWSSRSDDGWSSGKSSGWSGGSRSKSGRSGGSSSSGSNNWICAHCESSNFRTRTTCWQCGRDSPSSHRKRATEESPVHFDKEGFQDGADVKPAEGMMNTWNKRSEHWTCARCYFANNPSRTDCHKCGTAKIAAVAPRRASARKPVKL